MFPQKIIFACVIVGCCAKVLKHEDDNTIFKDSEDLPIKKENFDILRNDLDNVGVNLENFVVDVLKQFLFNGTKDSSESTEQEIKEETTTETNESTSKETTTEEISTLEPSTINPNNFLVKPDDIETTTTKSKKRSRRVRRQVENCTPKTVEELRLEKKHIEDLNREVKKLNELVVLLRDQRDILHILNEDSNKPNKFLKNETKVTLIKGLRQLNKKELEQSNSQHVEKNEIPLDEDVKKVERPTHKELEHLKNQLCETVRQLNETRRMLKMEQMKENSLEVELMHQKNDIGNLFKLVKNMSKTQDKQNDTILGTQFNFLAHPAVKNHLDQAKNVTQSRGATEETHKSRSRASELSDLAKILDTLNEPKRTQPTNDEILRVLNALTPPQESKSLNVDFRELQDTINQRREQEDRLNQIARALKAAQSKSSPQSKSDDIDGRLKELQDAINKLKPRDDDLRQDDEARFQAMLSNLIANQGQSKPTAANTFSKEFLLPSHTCRIVPVEDYNSHYSSDTYGGRIPPNAFPVPLSGFYGGYGPAGYNYGGYAAPNAYIGGYGPGPAPGYTPNAPAYGPGYGGVPPGASAYEKPYGGAYYPKPASPVNAYGGKPGDFFLHPKNQYDKGPGGSYTAADAAYTTNQGKYYQNTAATAADYKGDNVEDLKSQIYSLQNVINDLNRPEYTQKPEDKQTVYHLEKQIADLKNVVNDNDNSYAAPVAPSYDPNAYAPPSSKPEPKYRRRRSTQNEINSSDNILNTAALYLNQILQERPQNVSNDESNSPRNVEDIQNRLNVLKKQLEIHSGATGSKDRSSSLYQSSYNNILPMPYNTQYNNNDDHKTKTRALEKKPDLFTDILLKLTDRLLIALPQVLKKIFGFTFEELSTDEYGYGSNYGSNLAVFKNLGIFGYLPMIALKLIDALTYFMNALKKNKFLKTFLVPALVLGLVAGSVLFLIWFINSDDDYKQISGNNYNYDENSYGNNKYNYDYNRNSFDYGRNYNYPQMQPFYNKNFDPQRSNYAPVYSRSYFENIN
ncbi:unnamed protein product [Brassicogethes aeneus]|uniref:Uncharacterized protein n=1 Tax=Brassicogethes aeneus TaxID=1431903 RepID=A0A9P0BJ57_BRAAE|nr:unnamed protein product [Brassicogethes aeneus]